MPLRHAVRYVAAAAGALRHDDARRRYAATSLVTVIIRHQYTRASMLSAFYATLCYAMRDMMALCARHDEYARFNGR